LRLRPTSKGDSSTVYEELLTLECFRALLIFDFGYHPSNGAFPVEIQARLTNQKYDHSKDNQTHLVVSITAPASDWATKRPSICVLPVIDLSGSMSGAKLEYAKKSLLKLIDQLQPGDIVGLIGFESSIHKLMKPQQVTAEVKTQFKNLVSKLRPMGSTNLTDGFLEALKMVEGLDLSPKYIKRIILFTDGEPNVGVTDKSQILKLLKSSLGSTTVSAFGYGSTGTVNGSCDQDFLTNFAQEGSGNYAYVQDPDDALTAFGRELGGLLSTYAQNILVEINPLAGHPVEKAVTDVVVTKNVLGEAEFQFPDILAEETRHFVFDVKLKQGKAGPRAVNIFDVKTTYQVITSEGQRETKSIEAKVKAQFVSAEDAQKEPNKELDAIVALAQVVRAQLEAEEQAKKGQFEAAAQIMANTANLVQNRGHHNTARVAASVQHKVSSKGLYDTSGGYLSSMKVGGTRAFGASSMDAEALQDLSFCDVSLGNASMTQTVSNFVEAPEVAVAAVPLDVAARLWSQVPAVVEITKTPSIIIPETPQLIPVDAVIAMGDPDQIPPTVK